MQTKNAGNIKGLGIAVLALSIFVMLCCLLCFVLLGITNAAFGEGAFMDHLAYELSSELNYGYGLGYNGYDMSLGIASFIISILGVLVGWELLTCIVSLVAGVIAMRQAHDIAKYGSIFSWAIAGAIASLLGGRIIATALLVVIAVFANKDKNAAETAQWHAQGNAGFTQPGYAQASVTADPFYAAGAADTSTFPQQPSPSASGSAQAQQPATAAYGASQAQQPAVQQTYYPVQPQQPASTPYVDGVNSYSGFGQSSNQAYPQPTQAYQQTYCQPTTSNFPAAGVPVVGGVAVAGDAGVVDGAGAASGAAVAGVPAEAAAPVESAAPVEVAPVETAVVAEALVAEPIAESAAPVEVASSEPAAPAEADVVIEAEIVDAEIIADDSDAEGKRD